MAYMVLLVQGAEEAGLETLEVWVSRTVQKCYDGRPAEAAAEVHPRNPAL